VIHVTTRARPRRRRRRGCTRLGRRSARSVGSGVALGHPEGSLHLGQVHLIREHEQWYPPQPRLAQQLVQLLPSLVEARRISRVDDEDDARDALGRSPRSRSRRCSLRTRCRAAVVARGRRRCRDAPIGAPPEGNAKEDLVSKRAFSCIEKTPNTRGILNPLLHVRSPRG